MVIFLGLNTCDRYAIILGKKDIRYSFELSYMPHNMVAILEGVFRILIK